MIVNKRWDFELKYRNDHDLLHENEFKMEREIAKSWFSCFNTESAYQIHWCAKHLEQVHMP